MQNRRKINMEYSKMFNAELNSAILEYLIKKRKRIDQEYKKERKKEIDEDKKRMKDFYKKEMPPWKAMTWEEFTRDVEEKMKINRLNVSKHLESEVRNVTR